MVARAIAALKETERACNLACTWKPEFPNTCWCWETINTGIGDVARSLLGWI